MTGIRIGIIGGTRGIGQWFAGFFERLGCSVHISGSTTGMSIEEMANSCQVVVISVPISVTSEIISRIGPLMNEESLLMDLTSLKEEPVKRMLKHSLSEVIGCHPLFGPQVSSLKGQHVVLCPARSIKWLPWIRSVLEKEGALVVETTPEKHDELMSVVQVLNHLNTVAMGMALSSISKSRRITELAQFTTPFFEEKMTMVENIFKKNPRLYAEILCGNPRNVSIITAYKKVIEELMPSIATGDWRKLTDLLQETAVSLWGSDN